VSQMFRRESAEEREEIVQGTVVKIWKMLDEGTKARHDLTRTYLRRTAYSVFIDSVRTTKRRREEPLDPEGNDLPAPEVDNPETHAVRRELGRQIADGLGRLEASRREALVLYLNGHSVREIAAILDWSYKRTENLVYRGREQLQEFLEPLKQR